MSGQYSCGAVAARSVGWQASKAACSNVVALITKCGIACEPDGGVGFGREHERNKGDMRPLQIHTNSVRSVLVRSRNFDCVTVCITASPLSNLPGSKEKAVS